MTGRFVEVLLVLDGILNEFEMMNGFGDAGGKDTTEKTTLLSMEIVLRPIDRQIDVVVVTFFRMLDSAETRIGRCGRIRIHVHSHLPGCVLSRSIRLINAVVEE